MTTATAQSHADFKHYTSRTYRIEDVVDAYIGYIGDDLMQFEVNADRYTIKSYPVNGDNYPEAVFAQARDLKGVAFNQVKLESFAQYLKH